MGNELRSDSTSILSQNIRLTGEVSGPENIEIHGFIKGLVKVKGLVTIAKTGVVEADVQAANIVVLGKLHGNVIAEKQLDIQHSGQVIGNVRAAAINIREGAIFEGRSQMIQAQARKKKPAVKSTPSKTVTTSKPEPVAEADPKAESNPKVKGGWHPQAVATYKGQTKLGGQ